MATETHIGIQPGEYAEWAQALINLEQSFGELTPRLVLWEASKESSPLHGMFVWDDTIAANSFRESQARGLIRRVRAVMVNYREETEAPVSVFINVKKQDDDGVVRPRYVHVNKVLRDDDLRQQMLDNARRELATFRNKYAVLNELARVFDAIDNI